MERWIFNSLSANPTKWSNTQAIRWLLPTNFLSVFNHFVGLAPKGLNLILILDTWLLKLDTD